jgi:hypothetical protein
MCYANDGESKKLLSLCMACGGRWVAGVASAD